MRKTNWIIAIAIFLSFVILGFQTSGSFLPFKISSNSPAFNNSDQKSLLFIRVDSLTSPEPALKSVWAVFFHYPQHSIRILQLYPSSSSNGLRDWARWFSLGSDGTLAPLFIKAVQIYDFTWDGYFVLDDQGMELLAANKNDAHPLAKINSINESDQLLYLCSNLSAEKIFQASPALNQSIASHYRTDLDPGQLRKEYNKLTQAGAPLCNLIHSK